jgi:hypothetical protein
VVLADAKQNEPFCLHRDETFWGVGNHTARRPIGIQHSGSFLNGTRGESTLRRRLDLLVTILVVEPYGQESQTNIE